MRSAFLIVVLMFIATAIAQQPSPTANTPNTDSSSQPREQTRQFWLSGRPAWPLPPKELQTFGEQTEGSIKVAIYGAPGCIKRPGYYFLPRQARVSDAINAAQGVGAFATWGSFSGIQCKATNDAWEVEWFLVERRAADLSIILHDGDMIYIGSYPFAKSSGIPFGTPPTDLATFGEPATNKVKIAVFGDPGSIKRPGYYFLPKWPTVSNVIDAALGLDKMALWSRRSGVQRVKSDGTWESIQFSSQFRNLQSSIVLMDGDMIYLVSHQQETLSHPKWWYPPTNLATYGKTEDGTIKIAIYGADRCIKRPGYYFLRKHSSVADAIEAAQGLDVFAMLEYSGIQRKTTGGTWEIIRFSRKYQEDELSIILQEGDMIYMGRRPYE